MSGWRENHPVLLHNFTVQYSILVGLEMAEDGSRELIIVSGNESEVFLQDFIVKTLRFR